MTIINTDLLADVVTSYDQTKTTIVGRISQKTIGGVPTLGPSVPNWADVFINTGLVPAGPVFPSGVITGDISRVFVIGAPVVGSVNVILYNYNIKTGEMSYVGRLTVANQAILTTTIFRGFEVLDTGTTGWKIYMAMTNAILINGGLLLVNKVDLTDFTPLGSVTITTPTGNDQKATYLLQDPANIGTGQLNTASVGLLLDSTTDRAYVHNGVAATHQYYVYDTAIAPTYNEPTITITNANPGVVTSNAHGLEVNAPVLFKTTGSVTGLTNNTVYFVRNPGVNTFELSATSGGASINTTGTQSGTHTIGRAFGTTGSNFVHKTGNLNTLIGTLLTNNGENLAIPVDSSYGGLVGERCAAFGTSSNLYMGKLSELTSGAITWPSLTTANILGALNEVTTPTSIFCQYSNFLDAFVFISNTSLYYIKRLVNNQYLFRGGRVNTDLYEGKTLAYGDPRFGGTALTGFNMGNGVGFLVNSTTGQRGLLSLDMRTDGFFDQDYVVTKVINANESTVRGLILVDKFFDFSNTVNIYYRTSGFGTITGGWTAISNISDVNLPVTGQIQFKITYNVIGYLSQTAAQVSELNVAVDPRDASSNNWEYSQEHSSPLTPSRAAFRLRYAYSSAIPTTLRFKAYDLSNTLLISQTITSNPSNFEYSTDNGVSWLPLGTIPNTVGTLVRYTWTSPPGVDVRPSLRDS